MHCMDNQKLKIKMCSGVRLPTTSTDAPSGFQLP